MKSQPRLDIRPLTTQKELRACVALQRKTWGEDFDDVVPRSIMQISQRLGGVAAGAFDARGTLVGFVYGMTGVENGNIVHWSDMLAVVPRARNHGVGRRLKEYQRAQVATAGARVIYWTYDPLVARNAHLNFNVFGVRVAEYVPNMYGESRSPLHRGIGTDRLVVAWAVDDRELAARRTLIADISRAARSGELKDARFIEIPAQIDRLQVRDMKAARGWRRETRDAFQSAFAKGFSVNGFYIDDSSKTGRYVLTRRP
jgi:predicted GNAT superfamily acetyltransferase